MKKLGQLYNFNIVDIKNRFSIEYERVMGRIPPFKSTLGVLLPHAPLATGLGPESWPVGLLTPVPLGVRVFSKPGT